MGEPKLSNVVNWSDPGYVAIRETRMGDIRTLWVEQTWPRCMLASKDIFHEAGASLTDNIATFTMQNGEAKYEVVGEDEYGYLKLLVKSSRFEAPPERHF